MPSTRVGECNVCHEPDVLLVGRGMCNACYKRFNYWMLGGREREQRPHRLKNRRENMQRYLERKRNAKQEGVS